MWYTRFGQAGDVVLSTRIRLARNIEKIPFGAKMTVQNHTFVQDSCKAALPDLKFIDLSSMCEIDRAALRECHLISPEIAESANSCGILVNEDCTISVMLGEEDHIRIQTMAPGLDLEGCLDIANKIDDLLEEKIDFCYDAGFGYLTCCPTNTGTGLRASVMVHLPALTETGSINNIIRSLSKLGLAVRGIYGEGSDALGNIYQISNQVTLGVSEAETVEKLGQIISELIAKERSASLSIYENNKFRLTDRVMRAKGLLQNAHLMTSNEAMHLISDVRWGITLGIIGNINHEQLAEALYASLPANIAKAHNTLTPADRDLKRAEILRSKLT